MGNAASIGREIRAELSKTLSDVMLLAADAVTNSTPVDTGHAASNWLLSTGAPIMTVDGSREAVSTAAQDAGIQRIMKYEIGQDGPIYLRNNVLYLQFLDQGSSQQAPAGFVAAALLSASRRAPRGRKRAARKMLVHAARAAYIKTY